MQDQALIMLAIVLVVMFIEVIALFSIFLACSRGNKRGKSQASTFTSTQTLSPFTESDHDFSKKTSVFNNKEKSYTISYIPH